MCLFDQNPAVRRRSGGFIAVSMSCLVVAMLFPNLGLSRAAHPDLRDFLQGMFYGLSFGFSIGAIIIARRGRFGQA
ncbi:MAG TPA: hypothetical protein VL990_03210 [Acidobacteriaceae bacterium]|nr:hypothetical protein [Acidobacteriaceae bacterium]